MNIRSWLGLALALIVAGTAVVLAQDEFVMLAGFHITVARTARGVSLTCEKGCAWKRLTFLPASKPTTVNTNGLAGDHTNNAEKEGLFLLRFGADDEGFQLSCDRGCAWRTLGWAYPADGKPVSINEYGMAPGAKQRRK